MRQEERRQQTIRQLLDATKALIQEKGCHEITMKDIMERSELSKGAIFHYVKSKFELFAWVLGESLEETNSRFASEVERRGATFEQPMQMIARGFADLEAAGNPTNKVLMYLLGKEDEPAVAEVLQQFYERSVQFSRHWIVTGQQHGVIADAVDADKMAELFVVLALGLRTRSSIPNTAPTFTAQDFTAFVSGSLRSVK
ncbi:TetR/AcrR family transcriptional regulator [Paenibacillus sp. R14(2021)]|uniref:TetR/AcrR family transcriptional regulator n=1 Tax=Paenibacillus sp. R14(2021) TaxID=2859228 RepID=UPI001C6114F5|nr:TetR/AcrR family transcriptional regulator [Paenibacillus sp. R14(2021)]